MDFLGCTSCGTGQWTLTSDSAFLHLPVLSPAVPDRAAMLSPRAVLFFTLLLTAISLGQRARKPSRAPSPISTIQAQANFNVEQVKAGSEWEQVKEQTAGLTQGAHSFRPS